MGAVLMHNLTIKKFFWTIMALVIAIPLHAFDMEAAVAIYAENQQEVAYQEPSQAVAAQQPQGAPQPHTREYYQQRWLEQQNQAVQQQPVAYQPQQSQSAQPAPDAEDLFMAAVNGNNHQIGALLSQGLNVNVTNHERETALHMAAARGHYSTVIYLVKNGAYANARTVKNWIPLHHAVRFRHHNIANFLIKRGSSAGVRTSDGLSAIDMARNVNDYRLLSILGSH